LRHFHDNPFVYTLNPPLYRNNPIDQFLFENREGFCGHYASAFTQLMRLAGIPARMVIGFQGGEYNPLGDYFAIRNYDAHAWSEVWIEQQGWVRIDPTAAVAPERVHSTIQTALGSVGEPIRFVGQHSGFVSAALRDIHMLLDAMEVNWETWVLGYSREQQFGLMQMFDFDLLHHGRWGVLVLSLVFPILGLLALLLVNQGRIKQGQTQRLYQQFCRRMDAIDLPRRAGEGPLDYSTRVCRERPDLAPQIREITKLYIGLRYGPHQTRPQKLALSDQVRRFRPGRLSRAG
jgi:hypothetical protein